MRLARRKLLAKPPASPKAWWTGCPFEEQFDAWVELPQLEPGTG
jgi:hypothetical protein